MEKSKSNLMKSKSSNGTTAKNKTKRNDKKNRNHEEIKLHSLKKRGMYVEKTPTNTIVNEPTDSAPVKIKCAPRKKRCLTSTLDMLSETTNIMQCSNNNDANLTNYSGNSSNQQRQNINEYVDDFLCAKKKTKSKKYLGNFQNEFDDFVIHKSTKDFDFTPSNYSVSSHNNPEDIKWSDFLPRLVPKTDSEVDNAEMVRKSRHSKTSTLEKSNKDDPNVYNLFVDLVETTFNVYNVKTEFDRPTNARSSKNSIEVDMAEPKRTSSAKLKDPVDIPHKISFHNMHEDILDDVNRYRPASPISMGARKRKLKSSSFFNKKKSTEFTTRSFIHQKYTGSSKKSLKDGKKSLLKMLKEQLKIENTKHMEPQSFYQALKVMAKNKRQKTIQFDETANLGKKDDDLHRMFKKQSLLSTKKTNLPPVKKTRSLRSNFENFTIPTRKIRQNTVEKNMESRHSLQVFSVDSEKHRKKKLSVSPVASIELMSKVSSNEGSLCLSEGSSLFEAF